MYMRHSAPMSCLTGSDYWKRLDRGKVVAIVHFRGTTHRTTQNLRETYWTSLIKNWLVGTFKIWHNGFYSIIWIWPILGGVAPYRWQRWHWYFDTFNWICAGTVLAGPHLPDPRRNQNNDRYTLHLSVYNNDIIHSCEDAKKRNRIHWYQLAARESGPWFNIKMLSYQYRKSHCGVKTILRPSYLHNGISYTGKTTSWYWIRALSAIRSGDNA